MKSKDKEKAIIMRKQGLTYNEILREIPVAKSTLSLWLRDVGLAVPQKQRITERRIAAQQKGARTIKENRIKRQRTIIEASEKEIGDISKRELWLIGIALYWAEGSKEKERHPGSRAQFSNSDPEMIKLFLRWLEECIQVPRDRINFEVYIHDSRKDDADRVLAFWIKTTEFSKEYFKEIRYKRDKIKSKRYNNGDLYNGVLRVNITSSSELTRKIAGWTKGIVNNCGIV